MLRQPRGFTLVELLVVMSVVALLVAILLPALSMAREAARATVCLSQNRQVMLSAALYAEDYRMLPGTVNGYPTEWHPYFLRDHHRSKDAWKCPSSTNPNETWNGNANDWNVSYAFNTFGLRWLPIDYVRKPGQTVAWMDARYGNNGSSVLMPTEGVPGYSMGIPMYRHGENDSVSFVDTSARLLPFKELEAVADNEDGYALTGVFRHVLWNIY